MTVKKLDETMPRINAIYIVPEDATMHWESCTSDNVFDEEVKQGDIIITFYDTKYTKDYVVVHSDEWRKLIEDRNAKIQEDKEKWAECHTSNCDNCGDC